MTSTSTDGQGWGASSSQPWYAQAITDSYKAKLTENIFAESPILALLKRQTEKAKEDLKAELNRQMFGEPMRHNPELRQIISDAYDLHTNKPQEAEAMSAVDEIMKEREEEKVRAVFEELDGQFSDMDYDGAMCSFEVQFKVDGTVYKYAAILSGGLWYITGSETEGRKPEAFKAWIAETVLRAHRVEFRGTVL
jgi:hypothetical protein